MSSQTKTSIQRHQTAQLRGASPANRQAIREAAEAAALSEVEMEARRRQKRSAALRKMRLAQQCAKSE